MQWKYVRPLKDPALISKFEQKTGYKLPDDFTACVKNNNGGRPEHSTFNTDSSKGRAIKALLSFNLEDRESMWQAYVWLSPELRKRYVAFAIDNFGNLICFDRSTGCVVFIDDERLTVEQIANSFTDFVASLYGV